MPIEALYGLITVVIGIVGFVAGTKRQSKTDGQSYGEFIGELRANLGNIKESINEIKADINRIYLNMDEKIREHERRYHGANCEKVG